MLLQVQQALVGVNHLLKVYLLINHMNKRILSIILTVNAVQLLNVNCILYHNGSKNTTGKVATIRYKIDIGVKAALQMLDRLDYFRQMLMRERLVYAYVVVAPAEMGCSTGLYTCACAACNGIDIDVIIKHQVACKRKQCQLYCCSKTARISYILALADGTAVQFRQTVYERIVLSLQTVVH